MTQNTNDFTITDVRVYVIEEKGSGGDYHDRADGHWLVDGTIATPMSKFEQYKKSRTSWGIAALGSLYVEIETQSGKVGVSTGFGGEVACWLIENHFKRFLVGADVRDTALLWDQMYRAAMPYGRRGVAILAISVVDLALWDVQGLIRDEPVYKMIGGATKDKIPLYCTGPSAKNAQNMGFWGGKVPLPYGPADAHRGLQANYDFLAEQRELCGLDFPIMVDCYMALDVPYAVELAYKVKDLNLNWLEECLSPDDVEGHKLLKERAPWMKWTTGEHEYTRYGYRKLIESRAVDILQPDLMWMGGLTEALRVSACAAAYDIPVIPHGSGAYSYHFVMAQPHSPFCEYLITSPKGDVIEPVFGDLFKNEQIPQNGEIKLNDEPGFGLIPNPGAVNMRRIVAND